MNKDVDDVNETKMNLPFPDTTVANLEVTSGKDQERLGCCDTSNLRALWGMLVLNTIIAAIEIGIAIHANSLSMISDSASMFVDSFSYFSSILLERHKVKKGFQAARLKELIVSIMSILLLIGITLFALVLSIKRFQNNNENVNGSIVFFFAIGTFTVDCLMCSNYLFQIRHRLRKQSTFSKKFYVERKEQLNMISALVHLISDFLRSITGIIAGALEMASSSSNNVRIDSVATFVVCVIIFLLAFFTFLETLLQCREYRANQSATLSSAQQFEVPDNTSSNQQEHALLMT